VVLVLLISSDVQGGGNEVDQKIDSYGDYRDGNSVKISVPGISMAYGGSNMPVVVNTAIATKTKRFLELAKAAGVSVVHSKGIYNRRFVRGSSTNWSSHAWRMGIDVSGFDKVEFGIKLEDVKTYALMAGFEEIYLDYVPGKMHYDHVHLGDRVDGKLVPPMSM